MKENKPKNNFIIFRVTDKQREVIVDHAKKQGKTMSGFVRDTFSSILKNYTNETRQF
jgi:uncharacterized protein (DUF1778 family)